MFFKYIYENDLGFTTYDKYFNYIRSLEGYIPNSLFLFASDENRYNLSSKKSLHDSIMESLIIENVNNNSGIQTNIELSLLGAQHDRRFVLKYIDISTYNIHKPLTDPVPRHDDLLCHEFRLADGYIEHAIEFDRGVYFTVGFKSFEFIESVTTR